MPETNADGSKTTLTQYGLQHGATFRLTVQVNPAPTQHC